MKEEHDGIINKTIYISRLHGFNYPAADREDDILKSFFKCSQEVKLHCILFAWSGDEHFDSVPLQHQLKKSLVYPYFVQNITVNDLKTCCVVSNLSDTTLKIGINVSESFGVSSVLHSNSEHSHNTSLMTIVPTSTPLTISNQRYRILHDGHSNSSSAHLQLTYHDTVVTNMLHILSPTFIIPRVISGNHNTTTVNAAEITSHTSQRPALMLVDYQHDLQIKDIRDALGQCAVSLRVRLVTLDVRLFSHNASKGTQNIQHSLASRVHAIDAPLGLSNQSASACLSELSGERLVGRHGPCIVHVEGVDLLYAVQQEQQGHNGGEGLSSPEAPDEMFARLFKEWLNELHMAILNVSDHNQMCSVAVVMSTSNPLRMCPVLRALFPSCVSAKECALNTKQLCTVLRTACDDSSTVVDQEAALITHIESCGGSFATAQAVLQETRLVQLKAQHSSQWLQHTGLDEHLLDTSQTGVSGMDKLVPGTISLVPCISREGVAGGNAEGGSAQSTNKYITNLPPVYWSDIGGLDRVRREIMDVLELPLLHPHLFPSGCPRRQGVLLYGPPGTGKTLVAKAVATECKMSFISIKGPELLDSYVGESERNVRELFACARASAPCVLFFDEIDSLAPARARGHDSGGGVMDRIVSQLLTEIDMLGLSAAISAGTVTKIDQIPHSIDKNKLASFPLIQSVDTSNNDTLLGLSQQFLSDKTGSAEVAPHQKSSSVFIIAATNRPDLLDPALLRPGRFDRKVYLGVCKDVLSRMQILKAQTRSFSLAQDVDLLEIASALPDDVTGADIGAVTASAFGTAMTRKLLSLTREALKVDNPDHTVGKDETDEWDEEQCGRIKMHINRQTDSDLSVIVSREDLLCAARDAVPTVIDLEYYEGLGRRYDDSQQ